ncbi:GDP-perosamine synthase [Pseudolycoriella hygida]|uniref:GDP-perosamine synthase n=1 Tax=Pseudolycoriella hygida TaxID=35572 RepID=A0A9Q0NA54_9DIPT|nr:GDP-perosamine synthase [Pseudolycoriella hygida]
MRMQPAYLPKDGFPKSLPNAEILGSSAFYLPTHSYLQESDVDYVCQVVKMYYNREIDDITQEADDLEQIWSMIESNLIPEETIILFNGLTLASIPFFAKHADKLKSVAKPHTMAKAFRYVDAARVLPPKLLKSYEDVQEMFNSSVPLRRELRFHTSPFWDHHHRNLFCKCVVTLEEKLHSDQASIVFVPAVEESLCDEPDLFYENDWIGIIHAVENHPDLLQEGQDSIKSKKQSYWKNSELSPNIGFNINSGVLPEHIVDLVPWYLNSTDSDETFWDEKTVFETLKKAKDWADVKGVPAFLGEFGICREIAGAAEYLKANMPRVVILSNPRSGSTFLRGLLNSHPEIEIAEELLNEEFGQFENTLETVTSMLDDLHSTIVGFKIPKELLQFAPDREPCMPVGGWKYRVAEPYLPQRAKQNAMDAIQSGSISSAGFWPREMASRLRALYRYPVAQPCSNGFTALLLAMQVANIGEGDEVILPTMTMVAVPNAVHYLRAKPVFADNSSRDAYNPSWSEYEKEASSRTKCVIVTHTYGVPATDIEEIAKQCKIRGWTLIEDISECVGVIHLTSTGERKLLGTFGDFAAASLYANKMVHGGDGGFVIARDANVGKRLASIVNHGFTPSFHFIHFEKSPNAKMNGIGAAIAAGCLDEVETIMEHRSKITQWYRSKLNNLPIKPMPVCGPKDTPWPAYIPKDGFPKSLPNAEILGSSAFYLPTHSYLQESDVDYVCQVVKMYYNKEIDDITQEADDLEQIWSMIESNLIPEETIILFNGLTLASIPFFAKHADKLKSVAKPHTMAKAFRYVDAARVLPPKLLKSYEDVQEMFNSSVPLRRELRFHTSPFWDHHHRNLFCKCVVTLEEKLHSDQASIVFVPAVEESLCDEPDLFYENDWIGIIHAVENHPDLLQEGQDSIKSKKQSYWKNSELSPNIGFNINSGVLPEHIVDLVPWYLNSTDSDETFWDEKTVFETLKKAKDWADVKGVPAFLGEFGICREIAGAAEYLKADLDNLDSK